MNDYYDMGAYSRPVTTSSRVAQLWFNRGLVWCYGFNPEEGVRCFRKAIEHDDRCAMAYWGLAYAYGPRYNKPWESFEEKELSEGISHARRSIEAALARLDSATPVEQALIRALERRYQSDRRVSNDELRTWADAYARSMREVYSAFPDDLDVCALFAEAMMIRTPAQLWDLEMGEAAQGADTLETVAVLERALQSDESGRAAHPGVLHMYIHAVEKSPHPERALRACDALRDLAPDVGHLRHMPSHIDVLCGSYCAALVANDRAIEADRKYLEREGPINFYTLSRVHDLHFKVYAAMFLGQYRPALEAANELIATTPEALLRVTSPAMADWLEAFVAMKLHVLVRFGKWQEILEEPLPQDPVPYTVTTATLHYAKGVAHSARAEIGAAEAEQQCFFEALAGVQVTRRIFSNGSSLPGRSGLRPYAESSEATPGQRLESARICGMSAATRPARRAQVGAIAPGIGSGSSGCGNRRVVFLSRGTRMLRMTFQ